jgi:anaerobic selenocysteine-containing dehydrogenase
MSDAAVGKIKSVCPLDCWDQCSLLLGVENGRVVSVEAGQNQPVTGNFICPKGKKHLERINHPARLLYPMVKKGGTFKPIGWDEALQLMAQKISCAVNRYGPLSLLHFFDGGYGGLLKNLESRFFSALGGATLAKGSLCWGAGLAAQRYDFGSAKSHSHEDLLNSKLIIIWGRNPAATQVHLLPNIRRAREMGTRVILIDPVRTATEKVSHQYLRVKPASDGALALGMARVIIIEGLADHNYINKNCSGFEQFKTMCDHFTPERTAMLTGLPANTIITLAREYAASKPAAIIIGIGLQRHSNGGNTVRSIDALAALTGNIGIPGGGANYANFRVTGLIDHAYINGDDLQPVKRYFSKPRLAEALTGLSDPPVEFLYISRANPMVQVGDSSRLKAAFAQVPFIVTADHFMTDTALASDLVLPAAMFPEAEDLFFNSMSHQYLAYGHKAVETPGECRLEYEIFRELARLMNLDNFGDHEPDVVLEKAIKPLTEATGITLADLKEKGPLLPPGFDRTPWSDGIFDTPDKKYNFFSAKSEKDGAQGLPGYSEPVELSDQSLHRDGYKYWFITPHHRSSMHSTHRLPGSGSVPSAYLHPQTAQEEKLAGGEMVVVSSRRGKIELPVEIDDLVPPGSILVYQGWWHQSGAAVNSLTADRLTDLGNQAAYYDCLCKIEKKSLL